MTDRMTAFAGGLDMGYGEGKKIRMRIRIKMKIKEIRIRKSESGRRKQTQRSRRLSGKKILTAKAQRSRRGGPPGLLR